MTTWQPRFQHDRRQWLLQSGATLTEPDLEETASGLKVRIRERPELKAYARDVDLLMAQGVEALAEKLGTQPWMRVATEQDYRQQLSFRPKEKKPELHLLQPHRGARSDAETIVWWRFQHATLPIEAYLVVRLGDHQAYYSDDTKPRKQVLRVSLTAPDTRPKFFFETQLRMVTSRGDLNPMSDWAAQRDHEEWLVRNPSPLDHILQADVELSNERDGAARMLQAIGKIEELDAITIPDLRSEPEMLVLELVDSNLTGSFLADVRDFVDGAPSIEEAIVHYRAMLTALRTAGMAFDDPISSNEFLSALVSGNKEILTLSLRAEGDSGPDMDHALSLHLPTGTIVVRCGMRAKGTSADEIAHAWEESRTMASLTGHEDMLLAYARKYVEDAERSRAERIVEQRKEMHRIVGADAVAS